jgi:predicted transcriptional regulator
MVKVTYNYSFIELSGKPKRFLESQEECKIIGYGVSTDTVTLIVLFETDEIFKSLRKELKSKFNLTEDKIIIL